MKTIDDLKNLGAEKEFFIGIDSDGCVFDSMEPKHKECFCPAFINNYNLQSVSKYARDVWDFVNLYSQFRGYNRFLAVIAALGFLREHPEVIKRGAKIMEVPALIDWVQRETKLGNPALKAEIEKTGNPELKISYQWSLDVNEAVKKIIRDVPPFPLFRESLVKMNNKADVIVVSQTPAEALEREWAELGIDKQIRFIAGQEIGTKAEHLEFAAKGKYPANKTMMIGDAMGDLIAAHSVNALFYPIVPGKEDESWKRFHDEALDKFFNMTYEGEYQDKLVMEFSLSLPNEPSWKENKNNMNDTDFLL